MAEAPDAALKYLQDNPDTWQAYRQKFGALPTDFTPPRAPKEAEDFLTQNPDSEHHFVSKYGYSPLAAQAPEPPAEEPAPESNAVFNGPVAQAIGKVGDVGKDVAKLVGRSASGTMSGALELGKLGVKKWNDVLGAAGPEELSGLFKPAEGVVQGAQDTTNDWAKQLTESLSPDARAGIEKHMIDTDATTGEMHVGAGVKDPYWWAGTASDLGVAMAPGLAASGIAARVTYAGKFAQALSRLAAEEVPQSIAIKTARDSALKAAQQSAMIAGGLAEGTTFGGAAGKQVEDTVNQLDDETLMKYGPFKELRDKGISFEAARSKIAQDKALSAGLASAVMFGLTGAPLNNYMAKWAAGIAPAGSRAASAGKAAALAGGQGAVQQGAQQVIENETGGEATGAGTWDNVLEQTITGGALGAIAGGAGGALGAHGAPEPEKVTQAREQYGKTKEVLDTTQAAVDKGTSVPAEAVDEAQNNHKQATVGLAQAILNSGILDPKNQAVVAKALKQAKDAGFEIDETVKGRVRDTGKDLSQAETEHLDTLSNIVNSDHVDAHDLHGLIADGLANVTAEGLPILTKEGRAQRRGLLARQAEAEKAEAAKSAAKPAAEPAKEAAETPAEKVQPAEESVEKPAEEPAQTAAKETDITQALKDVDLDKGTPEQLKALVDRGLAKENGILLPEGRRQIMRERGKSYADKSEAAPEKGLGVVQTGEKEWTVYNNRKPLQVYSDERVAHEDVAAIQDSQAEVAARPAKPKKGDVALSVAEKPVDTNVAVSPKEITASTEGGGKMRAEIQSERGQLQAREAEVPKALRGQKHGVAMAERLVKEAQSRGLKFVSDTRVSDNAARVYEALERRGYAVKRNPANVDPGTGELTSKSELKPVFEVGPRKAAMAASVKEKASVTNARTEKAARKDVSDTGPARVSESEGLRRSSELSEAKLGKGPTPLRGLPAKQTVVGHGEVTFGPHEPAHRAAEEYMKEAGLPYKPITEYTKIDKPRAARIADAFDKMEHAPNDPKVKAAYEALAKETIAQYQTIKKTGLKAEPIKPGMTDPYAASPRLAIMDVVNNNHLWFFPTDSGFGGAHAELDVSSNPLLALTNEKIGDHPLRVNDVFRIVHDYFGHIKDGVGFRAEGEENAWRSHSAMYTPEARAAMTSETRGQNSWLNFGPYAEHNLTANAAETEYAPQKTGLLPDEFHRTDEEMAGKVALSVKSKAQTDSKAFKTWFGDSVVRNDDGSPMVAYHGTRGDFSEFNRDVNYFTPNADTAATFGENQTDERAGDVNVMPVYLAIKNPYVWDMKGLLISGPAMPMVVGRAKSQGYDGIVLKNVKNYDHSKNLDTTYVTFNKSQVKSAVSNTGEFDSSNPNIALSAAKSITKPIFHSALARAAETTKLAKGSPEQWLGTLKNTRGVKPEEIAWSGLEDWLHSQDKSVSREQVAEYLRANQLEVGEKLYGQADVNKKSKFYGPEVARVLRESSGEARDNIQLQLANDRRAYDELTERFPELGDNEDWDHVVLNDLVGDQRYQETKFGQYTLPGGENYKELLITLPAKDKITEPKVRSPDGWGDTNGGNIGVERTGDTGADFRSGHWSEPNVVAHVRFDERPHPNGGRTLHIAEVQSDWHQVGRKRGYKEGVEAAQAEVDAARHAAFVALKAEDKLGFDTSGQALGAVINHADWQDRWQVENEENRAAIQRMRDALVAKDKASNGVPNAPFKTTWPELAMKRMLRHAAENGYDRITWDTGATNADRFDLSRHYETIRSSKDGAIYNVFATRKGSVRDNPLGSFKAEELSDAVGKDLADKIVAQSEENPYQVFSGLDLQVGGEGMRGFYDKLLPSAVNKLVKQWGGKVERSTIGSREDRSRFQIQGYSGNWTVADVSNGKIVAGPFKAKHEASDAIHSMSAESSVAVHSLAITPEMRAAALETQPLFSRTVDETGGVDVKTLTKVAQAVKANLGHDVKIAASVENLPAHIRKDTLGLPVNGVFYENPAGGHEVWLVGENLSSAEDAHNTAIHEIVGHLGVRGALGEKYDTTMRQIRKSFPRQVRAAAARNGISLAHPDAQTREQLRNLAAEEVVAYATAKVLGPNATAKSQSVWGKIVDVVRQALRSVGILKKFSAEDIDSLILRARDYVRKNRKRDQAGQAKYEGDLRQAQGATFDVDNVDAGIERLHNDLTQHGGFTRNPFTGESPSAGWAFAPSKNTERAFPMTPTHKEIANYVLANRATLEQPNTYLGGWYDDNSGKTYLDISKVHSDAEHAQAEQGARAAKQLAMYNLGTGETRRFDQAEPTRTSQRLSTRFSVFKQNTGNKDLDSFFGKIGGKGPTLKERYKKLTDRLADRLTQSTLDHYYGIKRAEDLAGISSADSGYKSVRLSHNSAELTQAMMEHGHPIWSEGAPDVAGGRGFLDIVKPLGKDLNNWLGYMVARRASRLMTEGRENLFTKAEIDAGLALGRNRGDFEVAAKAYAEFQGKVLDFAQEAGIIDPETRSLWENADYVPFYRLVENGDVKQATNAGALGKVRNQIRRLRGGEANLGDPLENIARNWLALTDASLKAHAMREVTDNLKDTGLMTPIPKVETTQAIVPKSQIKTFIKNNKDLVSTLASHGVDVNKLPDRAFQGLQKMYAVQAPTDADVVSVWRDGKREYHRVNDPLLLQSLTEINAKAWGPWMEFFRAPGRLITATVTSTPSFAVRNLWRDMWQTFVLGTPGGGKRTITPILDTVKGVVSQMRMDPTSVSMLAGGGSFAHGYIRAGDTAGSTASLRRSIQKKTAGGIALNSPVKLWRFYRDILNASEGANRVAVYNSQRAAGKTRKEALYEARDILDFTMKGNNAIVQFLAGSVPFLNARLQGLYRLGRGLKSDLVSVGLRGLLLTAASMALFMRNKDDDRYKELSDDQKDGYWHAFDVLEQGDHWKIPKPFETGAIFATIPEAFVEAYTSDEPDAAKQSMQLVAHSFANQLNLSPRIQAVWPVLELAMNQDTFTGSPILTLGDQNVLPEDQDNPNVSPTYRAMAHAMPEVAPDALRSPKQLQHLGRGYMGNLQDYVLLVTDDIVRRARGEPAPPAKAASDMLFLRDFRTTGPSNHTRYNDLMFKIAGDATKVHESILSLRKQETTPADDRADMLEDTKTSLLDVREDFTKAAQSVIGLQKQKRAIQLDETMSPEDKRTEIQELQQEINDTARDVFDLRPGGKLDTDTVAKLITSDKLAQVKILQDKGLLNTAKAVQQMK